MTVVKHQKWGLQAWLKVGRDETNTPGMRARRKVFKERQAVFAKMRKQDPHVLVNGRLPAGIRKAYNREAAIEQARARAEERAGGLSDEFLRYALMKEARLAEKWGVVDKGFAREAERCAGRKTGSEIWDARQRLSQQALGPAYEDVTNRARKYLAGQ